jgi:hypothetical protein
MRSEDILELLRRQPFEPFRIFASNGRTYDVRHPDQAIVLRTRVVLGTGGDSLVPDHLEHLELVHIVRLDELDSDSQRRAG